jgi:hypothetical protein
MVADACAHFHQRFCGKVVERARMSAKVMPLPTTSSSTWMNQFQSGPSLLITHGSARQNYADIFGALSRITRT